MKVATPIKILLISSNSSGRGGGERYLVYLTMGLLKLGFEVHVLLSKLSYMDAWAEEISQAGAAVYRLPLKALAQRPLRFVQALADRRQIKEISRFCREIQPSAIVLNQQYDEDGLDYVVGALEANVAPVAGVMHMPMTKTKNKRMLGWLRGKVLSNWYKAHPYRLILVSEGAQKEFEDYYDFPRPTAVVNNGAPIDWGRGGLPSLRTFAGHGPVVGFIGQFVPQKNLSCIVNSWLATREAGLESKLLLVGDGPERQCIERLLEHSAPTESWFITGWTDHLEAYLKEIDLFVLASHYEGLPLSLVEAAGQGIPAVVAPFNGALDIARRAPWVRVTRDNSVREMTNELAKALLTLEEVTKPSADDIQSFRDFFSVQRMASEVVNVLWGKPALCT